MEGNNDKAVTYTAEQVEQMKQDALNKYKSDQEAGVQKLVTEGKFKDQVLDAVGQVAADNKKLITIFAENEKVGQEILDKYYGGKTIEEYKESIGHEDSPEQVTDELIERKAKSIYEANKIKDKKSEFINKFGLEGDELEAFNEEFSDRIQLKSFNIDKLDDHMIKSYKLATGYSDAEVRKLKNNKVVAKSTGVSGNDKDAKSEKSKSAKEVNDFLDKYM